MLSTDLTKISTGHTEDTSYFLIQHYCNYIVFEIIEKQWQHPKEVNQQLPLKKRRLDLWYININNQLL